MESHGLNLSSILSRRRASQARSTGGAREAISQLAIQTRQKVVRGYWPGPATGAEPPYADQ